MTAIDAPERETVETDRPAELLELPPSAKLVAKTLEGAGSMTQAEIARESLLPPRTVREGLGRLDEIGAVESRRSFSDARKKLYWLADE